MKKKKLSKFEFICKKCGVKHKQSLYAVAQIASGNNLIFTCDCGRKRKFKGRKD